jgi:hypothetical protein
VEEPEELENVLTLHNCFWHNWGSLMQQGSDIAPKYVLPGRALLPPISSATRVYQTNMDNIREFGNLATY